MKLLNLFKREAPPPTPVTQIVEVKESAVAPAIAYGNVGRPVWTTKNYENFAKEGYAQNPVVAHCIDLIGKGVANLPFQLVDGDGNKKELPPLEALLKRANIESTFKDFVLAYVGQDIIAGNVFFEKVVVSGDRVTEIYVHKAHRLQPIPNDRGVVTSFEYTVNGNKRIIKRDGVSGESSIFHLKRFNPIEDFYGMSMLEPIARDIDIHNEARAHIMALYQNGASPSGALIMKPVRSDDGSDIHAPQPVIDAAQNRLNQNYGGSANAGKPMVLGGNVDWKQLGMSPNDMSHANNMDQAARNICLGLGVPHILVVIGGATFNNMKEANEKLYEETIIPSGERLLETLNEWLTPHFDEDVRITIDYNSIEALSSRREFKQKNNVNLYEKGVITRDEARVSLDIEEDPDALQYKVDYQLLASVAQMVEDNSLPHDTLLDLARRMGLKVGSAEEVASQIAEQGDDEDEDNDDDIMPIRLVEDNENAA